LVYDAEHTNVEVMRVLDRKVSCEIGFEDELLVPTVNVLAPIFWTTFVSGELPVDAHSPTVLALKSMS
jgi:hypothetical protein